MNIFKVFIESGLAAQIIMIILVIFSIWSWAIFFKKLYDIYVTRKRGRTFLSTFYAHGSIKDFENLGSLLRDNVYGRILHKGLEEYKGLKSVSRDANPKPLELADNIKLAMEQAKITELEYLESALPSMSTIVTASPFLGLLGTVWGIMESFLAVRARGSAHITIVAPGISDALITTVYGLLVALPALFFHNYLRNRIYGIENKLDKFINDAFAKLRRGLIETKPNA